MTEVAENTSVEEPVAGEPVSTSYIGDDGNFTEGWMEHAGISEDLRSDLTLKATKNVAGMASQLVNAQKMIGKQPNMTLIPNEQSSLTEWDEFHKSMGRPDTPDEYEYNHIEGFEGVDEEMEAAFKNLAHSEGIRPSTLQKLIEFDDNRIMGMRQAMQEAKAQEAEQCEADLKKQWGNAFEERLHLANRMIEENTTEENKGALLEAMGNNPRVADFLANIAGKFVEHKIISADVSKHTPTDALAEADVLRSTPGYLDGQLKQTSPSRYKQITQQISKLMEEAYPE